MKALGITAMIVAIIAIFVPVLGPYLTLVCALLAAFGAGPGITFSAVAILLNVINVVLLSPSLWFTAGMAGAGENADPAATETVLAGMGIIFIGAQALAAIVLVVIHLLWKGSRRRKSATTVPE